MINPERFDPTYTALPEFGIKMYVDDWRPAPFGWTLARTITEAIEILATRDVVVVSLDYDIELGVDPLVDDEAEIVALEDATYFVESNEKFLPVARYIASMKKRPAIQFHTTNPDGEAEMRGVLGMNPVPDLKRIDSQRYLDKHVLS